MFIRRPRTRAVVGLCLSLIFAFVYEKLQPYVSRPLNALSTASVWQVVIVYGAGVLLVCRPCGFSERGLGVFLFIATLLLFLFATLLQFEKARRHQKVLNMIRRPSSFGQQAGSTAGIEVGSGVAVVTDNSVGLDGSSRRSEDPFFLDADLTGGVQVQRVFFR